MSFQSNFASWTVCHDYGFCTAIPGMYEYADCSDTDYAWVRLASTRDASRLYVKFKKTEFKPYVDY